MAETIVGDDNEICSMPYASKSLNSVEMFSNDLREKVSHFNEEQNDHDDDDELAKARDSDGSQQDNNEALTKINLLKQIGGQNEVVENNCTKNGMHHHTELNKPNITLSKQSSECSSTRGINKLIRLIKNLNFDRTTLTNEELVQLVKRQHIPIHQLENFLGKENAARCVEIRREFYKSELAELDRKDLTGVCDRAQAFDKSQDLNLDYKLINGACCENVIGHVKIPVGIAGPLILDGEEIYVPLATTEGCLVASTSRGLSALRKSGGVISCIKKDSMTRAPIVRFDDPLLEDALKNVARATAWLKDKTNKRKMKAAFNSTTSHGRLIKYTIQTIGREIHIRFEAQTGDAMGMNMCSKGVECALKEMKRAFPTMRTVTLSGNMCTDKKPSGINWIQGRGKSVECNAELSPEIVEQVFKVTVESLIDTWTSKVMIGSALAASIGGFNCQAANILSAIFLATGQDPAQNVTSSNCMFLLRKDSNGSLVVTCSMPSIECGTIGGGTILSDQARYLQMMGIKGSTPKQQPQQSMTTTSTSGKDGDVSGSVADGCDGKGRRSGSGGSLVNRLNATSSSSDYTNAKKLARIICATVMAGELSLLAALTDGSLVKSHMRHNRSSTNLRPVCQPF